MQQMPEMAETNNDRYIQASTMKVGNKLLDLKNTGQDMNLTGWPLSAPHKLLPNLSRIRDARNLRHTTQQSCHSNGQSNLIVSWSCITHRKMHAASILGEPCGSLGVPCSLHLSESAP